MLSCENALPTLRGDHILDFHVQWVNSCDAKGLIRLAKMCFPPCVGISIRISMIHLGMVGMRQSRATIGSLQEHTYFGLDILPADLALKRTVQKVR